MLTDSSFTLSMSSTPKRSPATTPSGTPGHRRQLTMDSEKTTPTIQLPPTPSRASARSPGLGRQSSTPRKSATPAIRGHRAGASSLATNTMQNNDRADAKAELIAAMDDLRDQLRKTETVAEQSQKQAQVLQVRLDESLQERNKLEERLHESDERLESLENEKRDALRQKREMESIYEAERSSFTKDREEMQNREEEMQAVIQRLKESLNQRSAVDDEKRMSRHSNNNSPITEGHFAPTSALSRSDSRNNSKILLQKDRVIEGLRLELAEAQIKLVETANMGGGRLQEVERQLLEARINNAKLMEDNESYQLLLSEKTLNGEFTKDSFNYMGATSNADALDALEGRAPAKSLADELSEGADQEESDNYRRLEAELKSAKDQNKALTLYINKIIERLLQHQDFETILDQSADFKPPARTSSMLPPSNDQGPPPPPKDQGFIQRAKSAVMAPKPKARPMTSQMPATPSLFTDPETAPSIPFGRGGRLRPQSDQYTGGAATVVNAMYRGGHVSPPLHGPQTPRYSQPLFTATGLNPNASARKPSIPTVASMAAAQGSSGSFPGGAKSETSSIMSSGESGDVSTPNSNSSPPRSEKEKEHRTFAGNKPRPLRLVQDQEKTKSAEDKAKRGSWMGWASSAFGAAKDEGTTPTEVIHE